MLQRRDKAYLIHDGLMYETNSPDFSQENGRTRITALLRGSQFKIEEVLNEIRLNAVTDFFLPSFSGGRLIAVRGRDDGDKIYVIEFPPSKRKIMFESEMLWNPFFDMGITLAFPWVYLVIYISREKEVTDVYPYYRSTQIGSLNDVLCFSNLPNTAEFNRCMSVPTARRQKSTVYLIGQTVSAFWNNVYTPDFGNQFWMRAVKNAKGHPGSHFSWWINSKRRKWERYITSIQWESAGITLNQVLNQEQGEER